MIKIYDGVCTSNFHLSNSNASLASSDGFEAEPGTVKVKKKDQSGLKTAKMGTFAFKATQFFESLGKKSSMRKSASVGSERSPSVERVRQSSGSQSSLCEMSEKLGPITPETNIEESPLESPMEMKKHIKHQGYVDIYSSFNKRKWGKRWCLVHENNFECYRTQKSEVCELEFLLKNCILRRAIEETKSELGLMLLENNREKITIEPINWTELGSWLRILMQETSTPATPEGLEGYMDDTHPYHEAVEITRVPDPVNRGSMLSVRSRGRSLTSPSEEPAKNGSHDNRDSGICSSESTDDRFNSLERHSSSPTVHPCFTDSSLPRVSVSETGAIYTQVKKPSLTGSSLSPATGSANTKNQSDFISADMTDSDKVKQNRNSDDDSLFFDFDIGPFDNRSYKRESSLVDEIMSELKIQQSNSNHSGEDEVDDADTQPDFNIVKRKSVEFSSSVNELSPIKSTDVTIVGNESEFLCSSFVDKSDTNYSVESICDKYINSTKDKTDVKETSGGEKVPVSVRRHPSNVSAKVVVDVSETLAELRTRLVQLKKDRISIRDRKQQISSERDREFLEAEYERLDRECKKVTDEIKQLEQSAGIYSENIENSDSGEQTLNAISELETKVCSSGDDFEKRNDVTSGTKDVSENANEVSNSAVDIKELVCIKEMSADNDTNASFKIEEGSTETEENKSAGEEIDALSENQESVHVDIPDTQQSDKDKNSNCNLDEHLCKLEMETACDNESVPKINNTLKESEELVIVSGGGDNTETIKEEHITSDDILDTLSKDFENKLIL